MTDQQLQEIHQQMFFEFGKCDLYHFEKHREIVIVKQNGDIKNKEDILKIYKY